MDALDPLVFVQVNRYFVSVNLSESEHRFVAATKFDEFRSGAELSAAQIRNHFGISCAESHILSRVDNAVFLLPLRPALIRFSSPPIEIAKARARAILAEWECKRRDHLLADLFDTKTDLRSCVQAFAKFAFSDFFSLWIFNPATKVFTCAVSRESYKKLFLTSADTTSLFEFLESKSQHEVRAPNKAFFLSDAHQQMESLNRIRIPFGNTGVIGIMNLYSKLPEFEIPTGTIGMIQHVMEGKYIESRIESQDALDRIERYVVSHYKSGELSAFLHGLVGEIAKEFGFEACSVFLRKNDPSELELAATWDTKHQGKPSRPAKYDLRANSLTARVVIERKLKFSYDLANDPFNSANTGGSKTYSEQTKHPGANWIGIPLFVNDDVKGVLRVKNKFSLTSTGSEVRNFRSIDISNLQSVAAMLSGIFQIESMFLKTDEERKQTVQDLEALNETKKVFLHEIRTPISTFILAPMLFNRFLGQVRGSEDVVERMKAKISDMRVMGERLKFITDTYFFDDLVARNQVEQLSVMKDIVFPVLNITREYFKQAYGLEIRIEPAALEGQSVFADKSLVNIAFNALIDNAGKYTYPMKRPIVVSGKHDESGRFLHLLVSNYGLSIHDDEIDTIFDKTCRGREAIRYRIQGTGTGLYLAKQILSNQRGDLILWNQRDPVVFAMKLPRFPL